MGTRRGVPTWGSHLLFNTLKMPTFLADSSTDRHTQTQTQTHTDPDMHSISNSCNHTILLLHCWENRQIEEQCFFFLLNSLKAKDQMQFPFFNSGKSFFFFPQSVCCCSFSCLFPSTACSRDFFSHFYLLILIFLDQFSTVCSELLTYLVYFGSVVIIVSCGVFLTSVFFF